jgi:hypothetical protein
LVRNSVAERKKSQKPEVRSQKKRRSQKVKARSLKKSQRQYLLGEKGKGRWSANPSVKGFKPRALTLSLTFLLASGFWLRLFFWLLVSGFWLVCYDVSDSGVQ